MLDGDFGSGILLYVPTVAKRLARFSMEALLPRTYKHASAPSSNSRPPTRADRSRLPHNIDRIDPAAGDVRHISGGHRVLQARASLHGNWRRHPGAGGR